MNKKNPKNRYRICYKIANDKNASEWREIVSYGSNAIEAVNAVTQKFAKRNSSKDAIDITELTCVPMRDPKPGRPAKA